MGTVSLRRARRQPTDPSSESTEPDHDAEQRPSAGPMRRVVCRFASDDIDRLDAVRTGLPKVRSRAALVRAFCLMGLDRAEQATEVAP